MDDRRLDERIGRRVRERREALGLSLEDLAARCGVSRSMISRIERIESSPTAALLGRLCAGLGLTLSGLMAHAERSAHALARRDEQQSWRDPETGYLRRMVSPPGTGSSVELVDVELPAGARVAFGAWPLAAYDQHVLVVEGRLTLTVGDEQMSMSAGDCAHMTLERGIAFENETKRVVRYLVVLRSAPKAGDSSIAYVEAAPSAP